MSVLSPCVGICRIDPDTLLCEGCRRSLAEIAEWPGYDEDRRRAIVDALPGRGPARTKSKPRRGRRTQRRRGRGR